MPDINRRWVLAERPRGVVGREHFEWREEPVPSIGDGEFLIRNQWLSCDAAQRSWMSIDTYIPRIPLGEVMASASVGAVVESKHPSFSVGDLVSGAFGWQDFAVSDGSAFGGLVAPLKLPPGVDPATALSLFGITGLTAYFGLLDVGSPEAGDTVVVSAAAGAVGAIVCQIAKLKGCRVIGIAGGARKCAWLRDEVGVDEAVDYKADDFPARLRAACPGGVDVFFDNVGGQVLDAVLANLASGARIALCGAVAGYSDPGAQDGIRNLTNLVLQRGTMRGFLIFDYFGRVGEAVGELAAWAAEGKIKDHIDVVEGLENAPDALRRLFTGQNFGKQLVRITGPADEIAPG
ncbi:NADP-dependent oxidoreductase [Mycolicibacterium arseniciresistens]|uniref:NADP-dependent oxidoreductase n=1 Tax=Mycolicibacterium arseniciresistens TaxID=3062257 RepID=A0ABT8UM92_9MYCO|nr:NADP-dependent oxidoreductase [Mycolicibacterium arseniciresistens]MDO3638931.1 NADP-dependent oxidoreductase [Mycolicibacterium arseniciresistens]